VCAQLRSSVTLCPDRKIQQQNELGSFARPRSTAVASISKEDARRAAGWQQKDFSVNQQQKNLQLTLDLARELELAEAQAAVGCADRMIEIQSNSEAAIEKIAGGFGVYCGAGNPVTQAVALGLQGSVSAEEFNQLEAFYFSRDEPVRVETCPLADTSLFEHYKERHYHVTEFSNVMVRPVLDDTPSGSATTKAIDIRAANPDELDLWVMTVAQGFAENYPVTHELLSVMKMFAMVENTQCFLARIDGRVVGGATLAIRGRIAGLFGASTLPEFRNRGVQTALLRKRLRTAAEQNCELAMSLAQPGSHSQRNITRLGFQTLYTRVKFERPIPAP
jgi:GNAT superfamily N-acetyltransferase